MQTKTQIQTVGGGIAGYGPGYDPNDPIDAKYPYWRVTIKDFGCSNGTTCTWTVDEKKAAIKMMARLRAMLNIPEALHILQLLVKLTILKGFYGLFLMLILK